MNTWTYSSYRAALRLNGEIFALVTQPNPKLDPLPVEKVEILINSLCQTNLANLQAAVRLCADDFDRIMNAPASHQRGQYLAQVIGKLERSTPSATAS